MWENIIIPESKWFYINQSHAYQALNDVYINYDKYKEKSLNLMKTNRNKFTLDKMKIKLNEIVDKLADDIPTKVELQLPKLSNKEKPKIKLPELKKTKEIHQEVV